MIGTRGHDLGIVDSPKALASLAQEAGIDAVQLVTYRSFPGVKAEYGYLSHGYGRKVRQAMEAKGIGIALLGCYINLLHHDLALFKEYLTFANSFGCPIVGTETGSVNPDYTYHPDSHGEEAFWDLVNVVKDLTDHGQKVGAMVGLEGVHDHVINTPKRMKRLLDAVDAPNLKVIFDPVNYLNADNYEDRKALIEEAIDLFGDQMVVIHIKDFVIEGNERKPVPIGDGLMDFEHLYACIRGVKYDIDMIIEEYTGDDLKRSITYLKDLEAKMGVS